MLATAATEINTTKINVNKLGNLSILLLRLKVMLVTRMKSRVRMFCETTALVG